MGYRAPRFTLQLEPGIVRSIVEDSGVDRATIAQKLDVDESKVDEWIATGVIEYATMQDLAECIRRPEHLFLRTVPLKREDLPDYRMAGGAPERLGADDLLVVRRVRYMRSAAKEMMEVRGIDAGPAIPRGIAVTTPAGPVARAERARLAAAMRPDGPLAGSPGEIYRSLRNAIEGANILVFQYPIAAEGVRGLSMTGELPCTILVNSRETAPARAFTLLHEYGHVLLGRGGVCDEHGTARHGSDKGRVEEWCNRFAASFLMPEAAFAAERRRLEKAADDPLGVVKGLARKFKTSMYAAAARAADLAGGNGAGARYGGVLDSVAGRHSLAQGRAGGRGGAEIGGRGGDGGPRYLDSLESRLGQKFIRLAVSSHDEGIITSLDLADYLDMNLRHLDGLRKRAGMPEPQPA